MPAPRPITPANDQREPARDDHATTEFIVEMARALAAHGTPAHRLEQAMSTCADRLGLHAEFFATPTAVFASVGKGRENATRLVRVESADINLDRLTRLDQILQDVSSRQIEPADAHDRLAQTLAAPSCWHPGVRVIATGAAAATAARFFGGGWREVVFATLAGLIVGVLISLAARLRRLVRPFDFVSGFIVAVVAVIAAAAVDHTDPGTIVISGLIILIPGLSLTISVSEIATRNIVAGSARLIGAATTLATIAFGVAVGDAAIRTLFATPPASPIPLPPETEWLALLLAPVALTILFNAPPRAIPAIALVSIAGFYTARTTGELMGTPLGVGAGAMAVGLLANTIAIRANKPAAVTTIPGIMLLVPGAIGFRSLSAFLDQHAVEGLQTAVLAVVIALALATGLLLANALLPPSREI